MSVAVIVPWRGGCKYREQAWRWVRERYTERFPHWQILEAPAPPGQWVKAAAIYPVASMTAADILVIADADVWCEDLEPAVQAVQAGAAWAIPHGTLYRLTKIASRRSTGTREVDWTPASADLEETPYEGVAGGGIVVLPRSTLLETPPDPRFVGWGDEDVCWSIALFHRAGVPWRGDAPMIHLWHPPQQRQTRGTGSYANKRLHQRYAGAVANPERLTQLIQEVHECLSQTSWSAPA